MSNQRYCTGTPCDCSECAELSLNDYQRSMHTYKKAHEECHALGIVGELAEVVADLTAAIDNAKKIPVHWVSARREILDVFQAAGHIADMVKKAILHGVPADRTKLISELGDVLWCIAAVASDNGITLDEVARENQRKLKERYPKGWVKGGGVRDETAKQPCGPHAVLYGDGVCTRPAGHDGVHKNNAGDVWQNMPPTPPMSPARFAEYKANSDYRAGRQWTPPIKEETLRCGNTVNNITEARLLTCVREVGHTGEHRECEAGQSGWRWITP